MPSIYRVVLRIMEILICASSLCTAGPSVEESPANSATLNESPGVSPPTRNNLIELSLDLQISRKYR